MSNEISITAWYNHPANIRYDSLATKHQQTIKRGNRTSYKTAEQDCIIMLQNNGKAKLNRQMYCGVGARAQAIWMIAAGAVVETFTRWNRRRNLKFGFRLQSSGLRGKRVNLLQDERGLPYVCIILPSFTWVSEDGPRGTLDPLDFEIWKMFVFWFRVGKIKFNNCWKMLHLEKSTIVSTGKILPTPKLVYVYIRVSQTFLHMSHYPSTISFSDTSSMLV